MSPRWQAVFVLAPEHGPLHFPHHGAFVRVLDAIRLPRLLAKHGRVLAQGTIDHLHGELRFGVKLDVVWDVRFFRRAGSFANSSGRYTALSSNT